jgi:hypothetical protein
VIRREWTAADGAPHWLLIPQIEHAHLAGRLAQHWALEPFAAVAERPEVIDAIVHHDDGWARWEACPKVDPSLGRPLSFMEMPLTDSLAIWSRSVECATEFGNLAGWMVASHFVNRLHQSTMAQADAAQAWIAAIDDRRADLLATWQAEAPGDNRLEVASKAVAYMRLLDTLSLWFCNAERTTPHQISTPDGLALCLRPLSPDRVTMTPWPLRTTAIELAACGAAIPIAHYASPADLAQAPRTDVRLEWHVAPQ